MTASQRGSGSRSKKPPPRASAKAGGSEGRGRSRGGSAPVPAGGRATPSRPSPGSSLRTPSLRTPSLRTAPRGPRRPRRPRTPARPPGGRLVAVLVVLAIGFGGIFVRLVWLQVGRASALAGMAISQRSRTIDLPARRGSILDRDGLELAMSVPAQAVFVDPSLVKAPATEAMAISSVLGIPRSQAYTALTDRGSKGHVNRFAWVARGVRPGLARRLQLEQLPGIGFVTESRRVYPAGSLASQVLGFVDTDGVGIAGLELQYQKQLGGRPGTDVVQEDNSGTVIPQAGSAISAPVPGSDVVLTIDRDIQYRAQQALAAAVKANKGSGGSIVVMDPHTGQILAMGSYPWFNPNDRSASPPSTYANRSITDTYEPGSVNKVITASAALEDGLIDLHRRLTVPDQYQVADHLFSDAETHPTELMGLADILAMSSNVGTIRIAQVLGKDRLDAYLHRFGLDAKTGVGFPQEASGLLLPVDQWSGTSIGSIPIGQGIAVTPLQMACVYATIANGGVWVQPSLVRGFVGPDGRYRAAPPPATHQVISPATAATVTQLLAYAVDVGTGQAAQIPGYWVAGKTGTARIPLPQGGYSIGTYHSSFIGFAPAADPAIVIAAVINDTSSFGGASAAPLFQEVARFTLERLRIPPEPQLAIPEHALMTR